VIPLTLWDAGIGFVYPRSKLTERRLQANNVKLDDAKSWPELRDNLANLQLLQEGPNKAKSDADFDDWLQREFSDNNKRGYFLTTHYFPDWDSFSYGRFGAFMKERAELLSKQLEKELT
jgi:hypothetical protein